MQIKQTAEQLVKGLVAMTPGDRHNTAPCLQAPGQPKQVPGSPPLLIPHYPAGHPTDQPCLGDPTPA